MGFYTRTLMDYNNEKTTFRVRAAELNAGNMAAMVTAQANLGTAINGMVLGSLQKITYGNEVITTAGAPVDPFAQRELKWLISYRDTITNKILQCELGTANAARLDPNARGQAELGDAAEVDAFVAAFEAYAVSDVGNPVEVVDIRLVGRNV